MLFELTDHVVDTMTGHIGVVTAMSREVGRNEAIYFVEYLFPDSVMRWVTESRLMPMSPQMMPRPVVIEEKPVVNGGASTNPRTDIRWPLP